MRVTERDVQLLRDMSLSHLLSRDQVLQLGYFSSVTRANTRLRELADCRLVRRLTTPFFKQSLYLVGPAATEVIGPKIAALVLRRQSSPRFIQHALMTTNVRIALQNLGGVAWKFEQQLWTRFDWQRRTYEVRPDGMCVVAQCAAAIEVDLGHVAPDKFAAKLRAYDAFVNSGEFRQRWKLRRLKVLVATASARRAANLAALALPHQGFEYRCVTFQELDIPEVGAWS